MGNTSSLQASKWDDLFQALTRPDDLKAYLVRNLNPEGTRQSALRTQIELLTGTLQVDLALLKVNEVAESFDTATFCLGQLVSHEPQLISELSFAHTVVEGLSCALRKGWNVHHGVGKFAANALTILSISEAAAPAVREFAIDELLHGLAQWLCDAEEPLEVDEVCGCNCGCAALSATCWLERLLGKPDALLEAKLRDHPKLPAICKDLFHVVSRRDGNPFSLTRLLYVPKVFSWLVDTQPQLASDTLCFLTFGLLHFDNPMFSEDAVQALQALLRETGDGHLERVLGHRASLPLLEALSTCACYSPSAISVLESVSSSAGGRASLYSLATALSVTPSPAAQADAATGDADGNGGTSDAPPAEDVDSDDDDDDDGGGGSDTGRQPSAPQSGEAASGAGADPDADPDAGTASAADASPSFNSSFNSRGSAASERRANFSRNGKEGGGLLVRVLHEAGALAAKLRAVWPAHRLTVQARTGVGSPRPGSGLGGDSASQLAAELAGGPSGAGAGSGAAASADGAGADAVAAAEQSEDGEDGETRTSAPGEHAHDEGELPGGVEAWDRFVAELPLITAMTLAGLATAALEWAPAAAPATMMLAAAPDALAPDAVAPDAVAPDAVAPDALTPDAMAPDAVAPDAVAPDAVAPVEGAAAATVGAAPVHYAGHYAGHYARTAAPATAPTTVPAAAAPAAAPAAAGEQAAALGSSTEPAMMAGSRLTSVLMSHSTAPAAPGSSGAASSSQDSATTPHAVLPAAPPLWPNLLVPGDVVKAWVLLELVGFRPGQEEELLGRMTLSDKRVWLSRRLYREHHGGRMSEEDAILFIECTRDDKKGAILSEMRAHYADGVGLAADLSGTLEVHFKEENSAGSAVKREWFALTSDALVAPEAGVLVSPDRGCTFRPRPTGPQAPEEPKARQLLDLELLGRLLGLALLQQATVGFRLHPSVCKLLLCNGEPWEWTHDDVRALDPQLYQHKVDYVLNNDVAPLCLDFTDVLHDVQAGELGERDGGTAGYSEERIALLPGGEEVEVTEQNKQQFVALVCAWRLFGSIEAQTAAVCRGFQAAVPPAILTQLAALVTPEDLATILAGEAVIDVVDWEVNTQCAGGLRRKDRLFRRFWRAVRSFTPGEREQLLQFVTGSRRPPAGGFAQLQGFNGGVHKFTLCLGDLPTNSLPRAHACICTIDLPPYATYAVLRRSVYTALSMGCVGFDDAAVADGGGTRDAAD